MTQEQYENKVVFITGTNRGIGKALVEVLLQHRVKKIYAAARDIRNVHHHDARVVPVQLDITNREQIQEAVARANDVNILINNAGTLSFSGMVKGAPDELAHDMQVNYFGTLSMVQAFVPVLEKNGGGAIANVISVAGLASLPAIGSYSASKAALFSATQTMRAELQDKNITVHGIFPGPIDTDMAKGFDVPKTSAANAAENIIASIAAGEEDIFPDTMSQQSGELWYKYPRGLAKQLASM